MPSFTETVRQSLRDNGWEIYEGLEHPDLYEWWWIPGQHKGYWSDSSGKREDNYMPIKDAIAWQMHTDKGTLTEELKVT